MRISNWSTLISIEENKYIFNTLKRTYKELSTEEYSCYMYVLNNGSISIQNSIKLYPCAPIMFEDKVFTDLSIMEENMNAINELDSRLIHKISKSKSLSFILDSTVPVLWCNNCKRSTRNNEEILISTLDEFASANNERIWLWLDLKKYSKSQIYDMCTHSTTSQVERIITVINESEIDFLVEIGEHLNVSISFKIIGDNFLNLFRFDPITKTILKHTELEDLSCSFMYDTNLNCTKERPVSYKDLQPLCGFPEAYSCKYLPLCDSICFIHSKDEQLNCNIKQILSDKIRHSIKTDLNIAKEQRR